MLGGGDTEPMPDNRVFLTRSDDQGETWTPLARVMLDFPDHRAQTPSEFMVLPGRCVLYVSTHDGTFGDWRTFTVESTDGCRTWSSPVPLPGFLAERSFIRPHIVSRDGRLIVPWQYYWGMDEQPADLHDGRLFSTPRDPRNGVTISADGGRTWSIHGHIRLNDDPSCHAWAEPAIAELSDGRIAMLIRNRRTGVLYRADSPDGGRTWPQFAQPTDIPNPGAKVTLYQNAAGAIALVHNPNPTPRQRRPLSLWVSYDDLQTWPYQQVLVPESLDGPGSPGMGLSYPDGFLSADGHTLHIAFDDNRHRAVYVRAELP
jgi:predicted neuraminidase